MSRTIAFLIFEDFQILDLAGPLAAFEICGRILGQAAYRLRVMSAEGGLVRSSSGMVVETEAAAGVSRPDTLVVAGGIGTLSQAGSDSLLTVIERLSGPTRRVCSVCSGSFLLSAAGLLNERQATTHWRYAPVLAREYPRVQVSPDRIYVRDGKFWTSAGVTAGIDLALALIADDLGEEVSRAVAQEMVVYHRRTGGQSQFSSLLELEQPTGRFSDLMAWMREHLADDLSVDRLADQAAMSTRNFARAFRIETGTTPAKVVERLRLESALAQVETTDAPFSVIAETCGFGDADRMRRAFLRVYGQTPQALRRSAA